MAFSTADWSMPVPSKCGIACTVPNWMSGVALSAASLCHYIVSFSSHFSTWLPFATRDNFPIEHVLKVSITVIAYPVIHVFCHVSLREVSALNCKLAAAKLTVIVIPSFAVRLIRGPTKLHPLQVPFLSLETPVGHDNTPCLFGDNCAIGHYSVPSAIWRSVIPVRPDRAGMV